MMRILLIEDNEDDACLIRETLLESADMAMDLEWVDRLEHGLTRLANGGIDAVLLDLGLSDSGGLETFGRLHAEHPGMPVVVLTGFDDEQTAVQAVQRGAQDYVAKKDLDHDRLVRALRYAIERQHVQRELRRSSEQLRSLTGHLQTVREEERTRIARELHDELGQRLSGLKMDVVWLRRRLEAQGPEGEPCTLAMKTSAMIALIDDTIMSLRKLVSDLRPAVLDHLGLAAALEWQAKEFTSRTGIECTLVAPDNALSTGSAGQTALFRIVQEALTNVMRHAKATRVTITLQEERTSLRLSVEDNGRGISDLEAAGLTSFGLMGIKERITLLGGTLTVRGQRSHGTTLTACIPLTPVEDAT